MNGISRILVLTFFSLFAWATADTAMAGNVTLQLSDTNPGVGDLIHLKITCANVNGEPSQPTSVPGFEVRYFTLTGSGMKTVYENGNYSSSQYSTYTVTLRATKEGHFSFGPITVGGVKSNTIKYTIGPKSTKSSSAPSNGSTNPFMPTHAPVLSQAGGNDLFLRAEVSNANPYEQEPVVYTVKMYSSYEGTQLLGSPSAPSFENCTSEVSNDIDHNVGTEIVNGKEYRTAEIMRYILFPAHSGGATIKGNTISFTVKQRLDYDDGSQSVISTFARKQIDAEVPTVTLNVKSLPASTDGSHINGVGEFKVASSFTKLKVAANQIVNVKYTVSGSGNLNFISLPDFQPVLPPEIKFVKAESKIDSKISARDMTGSVEYTVSLIPTSEGKFEIPPVSFRFFNPEDGSFYMGKASGAMLEVGKGIVADDASNRLEFNSRLQPIGKLYKHPLFLVDRFPYYLIYIIPLVLLIIVLFVYRRHIRVASDIVGLLRKKAAKTARTRLKRSAYYMKHGKRQEFYAETLKALWGYMAHKLNIPVAELSRDNVCDKLKDFGASQALLEDAIDVIDKCEMARYASSLDFDMKTIYRESANVIDNLEKIIPTRTKQESVEVLKK